MKLLSTLLFFASSAAVFAQVPYERIVNAHKEPGNWLTYSGNYSGHRYSPLTELTPANVANLRVKWAYQFDLNRVETSPIVDGGIRTARAISSVVKPHTSRSVSGTWTFGSIAG